MHDVRTMKEDFKFKSATDCQPKCKLPFDLKYEMIMY